MADSKSALHIVLFPFMSKGHTIPLLHLARLLLHRGSSITVFTTPANCPFIRESLSDTSARIISIPFPEIIEDGIPGGVESTDKLPDMSLFYNFALATKSMMPHFEAALKKLPFVTFMITDGFLPWTFETAAKLGIPRLVSYGMGNYPFTLYAVVARNQVLKLDSDDELFSVTDFESVKLTRNDFHPTFIHPSPKSIEFHTEIMKANSKSYGLITNSFYELEPRFVDYWNREFELKSWCVGPLCLVEQPKKVNHHIQPWMQWLDSKLAEGKPVLYIAFGSQAKISDEQFTEIKAGLENANVNFVWVVRSSRTKSDEFEERVKERGLIVREWVDQMVILRHGSVQGFLSHCGWNSVLESVCARVPILAWPMMAEQHLNTRFVVEEIKIGLRVETVDNSVRGFVESSGLEKMVRELMEGEMGKKVRKKVMEVGEAAIKAAGEGGSSWNTLNELINELHAKHS